MSWWRHFSRGARQLTSHDAQDEVAHYFAEARAAEQAGAAGAAPMDEERTRDQLRAYGWENTLSDAAADLRYAARQLRHNSGFTIAAVVVLALGIGVGTAMFSVLNAALLRSLPYAHAGQLATVAEPSALAPAFWNTSHADLLDWRSASHSFQSIAFYQMGAATVEGQSQSTQVAAYQASNNLFATLGRRPWRGRGFTPADARSHAAVTVLNYDFWQQHFQGAPALGTTLKLNGHDVTVIGIMPRGFSFPLPQPASLWLPYIAPIPDQHGDNEINAIGRLRPGVTAAAAQSELSAIQARIARQYGKQRLSSRVAVTNYKDSLIGSERPALWAMTLAVALVWLIACASVAGLMLTRLTARRRELAVRAALGAGRGRLARQLLSESLLLGLLAGLGGCLVAFLCIRALRPYLLAHLSSVTAITLSPAVLAALIGSTLLSVVLIGLAPALGAARTPAADGLADRSLGASRAQTHLRHGLVVAEIALALLLLAGAGLFLRTLYALHQVPLGFTTENIVATRLNVPTANYAERSIYSALEAPLLEQIRALPGVEAAAVSSAVPLARNVTIMGAFGIVGKPNLTPRQQPAGDMRFTSPGYAKVFNIPIERGRFFNASLDSPSAQPVVVINHAMAERYFHGQNPVGQQIRIGKNKGATIIGVLGDVHVQGVEQAPGPVIHFAASQLAPKDGAAPFYNIGSQFLQLAVRTAGPVPGLENQVRTTLHSIAPAVSTDQFETEQQLITTSLGNQIFAARLLSLFGLAALLIALAGLYGLLAYTVAQRRREMGIRLALGASPAQIRSLVLRNAGWMIASGVGIGLGLALGLTKVMAAYLYGVAPRDPLTLAAAAALLALCALAAAWFPARHAAGIPVVETLRTD